jgi:hypothetical protein
MGPVNAGSSVGDLIEESGSIIVITCEGQPGSLTTIGDWWFAGMSEFERGVTEDGWDVEWLAPGCLGTPR